MGGTARCAASLFQRRAKPRIFRSLGSYTQNKSAQTGTPTAASARAIVYRYVNRRSQVPTFPDHLGERPLQIGEWRENRSLARIENDIQVNCRPFRAMQSERRPQTPLNPVAHHRSAQRLGDRKADSNACSIPLAPRHTKGGEQRTGYASAVIINRSEIGGPQYSGTLRKRLLAAGARFNGSSGQLFRR
jgi:hypothetical protein